MNGYFLKNVGRQPNRPGVFVIVLFILLGARSESSLDFVSTRHLPMPSRSQETVVDVDGNVYHTVSINAQVWLVENLRTTSYRDGTAIPRVSDNQVWSTLANGAYCDPAVDSTSAQGAYGLLYNFHAVNDSRALCPRGWHVPAADEWRLLIDQLGGVDVAGGKMKATAADLWMVPVAGTTNESGFSAVPAGGRGQLGSATDVGYYATWWASTSHDSNYAWHWGLYPDGHGIRSNPGHKASGFSVRCVKD